MSEIIRGKCRICLRKKMVNGDQRCLNCYVSRSPNAHPTLFERMRAALMDGS